MPTLNEIVERIVERFCLHDSRQDLLTGKELRKMIKSAAFAYARSIVPEARELNDNLEPEVHIGRKNWNYCRTEILNKIDEAEKSL